MACEYRNNYKREHYRGSGGTKWFKASKIEKAPNKPTTPVSPDSFKVEIRAGGERHKPTPCLRKTDPWIQPCVQNVDKQIYDHDSQADQNEERLNNGEIPMRNRIHEETPHAGHGEYDFGYDRSAKEPSKGPARDGDDGEEGIPERMPKNDNALSRTFRPGSPHEVLAHHL
jgi:hypothetical protein